MSIKPLGECISFKGHIREDGYGILYVNSAHELAHRFFYRNLRSEIPEGMVLDHLCRNRSCINPDHIEIVTNKENILRGEHPWVSRGRMVICENGHERAEFSGRCRTCRAEYMRNYNRRYYQERRK